MTRVLLILIALILLTSNTLAEKYESSSDLCTKRCTCFEPDSNTLRIDCERKQFHDTIANWPQHSEHLIASFSYNNITTLETLPASGAKDIKIAFSYCQIKYLHTGLFESLPNIKYVDLSHNLIESDVLSGEVFKGPYNNTVFEPIALEYLDLSYNRLHSLKKNVFEHTLHLKFLNLEGNNMRIIDQVTCFALSKVPQVENLNLARNRLLELPRESIEHFGKLSNLNLSSNEFDFLPESLGFVAETLTILDVSDNPIIELDFKDFEGMGNLTDLFANNLAELTRIKPRTFASLRSLKELHLNHNHHLTELDADAFGNDTSNVQKVYLFDNALATLPRNLLRWELLDHIDLRHNHFICTCDLRNISEKLSKKVKNSKDIPYCLNPMTTISVSIFSLSEEECLTDIPKKLPSSTVIRVYPHENLLKLTLTVLVVMFCFVAMMAIWISYTKWKVYRRKGESHFQTHVRYNAVHTEQTYNSFN